MADYKTIYDRLIEHYKANQSNGFTEKHHIVPRCMGGGNESENIIKLTARAHFIAHLLLAKIHGGKLVHAAWRMSNDGKHGNRRYEWLRREQATQKRIEMLGNNYGRLGVGVKRSEETKMRMSVARKGQPSPLRGRVMPPEHRAKIGAANAIALLGHISSNRGRKASDATRNSMSKARKGIKLSEAHRNRISEGMKRYRAKIREAA